MATPTFNATNMTLIEDAEATSGWTGVGDTMVDLETDFFQQGNSCIANDAKSTGLRGVLHNPSAGPIDFTVTDRHLFIWVWTLSSKLVQTRANGGCRVRVSSSSNGLSNYGEVYIGGSDVAWTGNGWHLAVIDVANVTFDNTSGTVNRASIDNIGFLCNYTGTAARANATACDIMYYGEGIEVTGGTSGDPITLQGIVDQDEGGGGDTYYGMLTPSRDDPDTLLLNGRLEIGDVSGASNTYLDDDTKTILAQDNPCASDFTGISFDHDTGTTEVNLGVKTGSGDSSVGSSGIKFGNTNTVYTKDCYFRVLGTTGHNTFNLYGCSFDDFTGTDAIQFGTTTTALGSTGDTCELVDNSFTGCGRITKNIDSATILEKGNKILFSTATGASLDDVDVRDCDVNNWSIIQSDGFIHTPTTTITSVILDYDFNLFTKPYIQPNNNETWNMDDPTVTINTGTQDELDFLGSTLNSVNKRFTVDINAKRGATNIQNVYAWLGYTTDDGVATTASENNTLPTANRVTTDSNGDATSKFVQDIYTENTATTLNDEPKTDAFLVAYHYPDLPMFRAPGTVSTALDYALAVIADPNINETTQATAITNGSGITFNKDSSTPWAIIYFTSGTGGTLNAGDTVRGGTSNVTGIYRELVSGTLSGTGAILVENVSGTFQNGETIDTDEATTWEGTSDQTSNPQQEFDWAIDCNAKSLQVTYDYLSARMAEVHANVVTSGFDDWIRWCEDENQLPLQAEGGDSYKTERNVRLSEGVILWNYGAGNISKFTDNSGGTFVPPTTVTLSVTVVEAEDFVTAVVGARVGIHRQSDGLEIMNTTTNGSGLASTSYVYTTDTTVFIRVRDEDERYVKIPATILSSGLTQTVGVDDDDKYTPT